MQKHAAKRIYSPQSLESWFGKLDSDWFAVFTPGQLARGRRIYRDGEIRELELTAKDAIIHRRVEKRDEYTIIEWEAGDAFHIRSSTTDTEAARALAVAGLHEIEELLSDELPPLPDDTAEINGSNGVNGSNGRTPPAAPAAPAKRQSENGGAPAKKIPPRPLILTFATSRDGLSFQAFWKNTTGSKTTRTAAFTQSTGDAARPALTTAERARLISLASLARKSHFVYNAKTGDYLLSSIAEIPAFLKTTLPSWRRAHEVELDPQTDSLLQTTRTIEISAEATRRARGKKTPGGANGKTETRKPGSANAGAGEAALDLRWIFKAGERLLTDDEVALVTKRGSAPTLLPGVGIVSLPADRLETLETWRRNLAEAGPDDTGALPPYLVFSLFNDARLQLTLSPEVEAWRQTVLTPAPFAKDLPEILRPYQRRGVQWMHHLCDTGCHGLLADEMGLGKTLQTISLLATRPANTPSLPALIVCPASVVPVWQDEFAKFAPHIRVQIVKNGSAFSGNAAAAGEIPGLFPAQTGPVWIASYAQLRKHRAQLDTARFGYAVLDEGQFIKNPSAKTTQTCFAIRAEHRIVLSGTPLENRQLDLWSIFRFLLPGLLGTRANFEAALATDRDATLARLRAQVAPFILRRTKDEVATELPPKIEMELVCPLTDVQRAEYARVCSEGLQRLGDDMDAALRERSFGFLALLTRLRQVCCDPDMLPWMRAPLADSGKIALLVEKLAEILGSGHKVVIFSQFVMLLERVHEALALAYPDIPRHEITGMTKDRFKPVQAFQNASGAAVMLVSLKAGGTGITLHAADYVFLLDPWWNPAVEAQAIDRVHRIGQSNTVFVYRMVTAGTIEERIQALKDTKRDLFKRVVGDLGGDRGITEHFKTLHELVQLTTAEVVEPENAPDYIAI